MSETSTVGIIGAGQMGCGIAHVFALSGARVLLNDISQDRIEAGIATITGNLARQVAGGRVSEAECEAALARIHPALNLSLMEEADLAIEAASEDEAIKTSILREVSSVLPPQAIIASNTSSLSITRLAASTDRPEQFIGMHFMNPVPVMELVEIIRGIATSDETFEKTRALVDQLGKSACVAEDFPAFIVNRLLLPMINEAVYALHEGVGDVISIDKAMKLGANHRMGPFELADFIGLDTCLSIMQVLFDGLADSKYRHCPLLVKYVEAGWLGHKPGKGFYDYSGDTPVPTR
ncbi:MAG: 3-hydroxybutyryl-CoA dehydrogenase [Parvibaculales bacterium]